MLTCLKIILGSILVVDYIALYCAAMRGESILLIIIAILFAIPTSYVLLKLMELE